MTDEEKQSAKHHFRATFNALRLLQTALPEEESQFGSDMYAIHRRLWELCEKYGIDLAAPDKPVVK